MVIFSRTKEAVNITNPTNRSLKVERRANKRRTKLDEAGFWDALGGDRRKNSHQRDQEIHGRRADPPTQLETDVKDITGASNAREKNEQRRASLLSMLHASEERHKIATSRRPSVLAKGVAVVVTQGESIGQSSLILDADYINNRVLLLLSNQANPQWLSFKHVSASVKSDPSAI